MRSAQSGFAFEKKAKKIRSPEASYHLFSWLMALSIWRAADFCSGVRQTQLSNNSFMSGGSSTISASAKNCDMVMPNPLQMVSRVAMEGIVFLLKMLPIVDCAKPHSFESLYSVHPRSRNNCWRRVCVSIASRPFLYLFYFQDDAMTYAGTIYLEATGNLNCDQPIYTASLVGTGLHLSPNLKAEGGVISAVD